MDHTQAPEWITPPFRLLDSPRPPPSQDIPQDYPEPSSDASSRASDTSSRASDFRPWGRRRSWGSYRPAPSSYGSQTTLSHSSSSYSFDSTPGAPPPSRTSIRRERVPVPKIGYVLVVGLFIMLLLLNQAFLFALL
ncbi:hypothetical protein C8R46DRAFT_1229444 [Mycena filopes]|nr:hypothetical protein C8R46DRAFT_1229444 [Mycena filopes]